MVPAHPAPAAVAVNHGVYVLPHVVEKRHQYCYSSPCEEVLQKPSLQLMRDRGAVFLDGEYQQLVILFSCNVGYQYLVTTCLAVI